MARLLVAGITDDTSVLTAASEQVQVRVNELLTARTDAQNRLARAERQLDRESLWAEGGNGPVLLAEALENLGDGTDTARWNRVVATVIDRVVLRWDKIEVVMSDGSTYDRPRQVPGRRKRP